MNGLWLFTLGVAIGTTWMAGWVLFFVLFFKHKKEGPPA